MTTFVSPSLDCTAPIFRHEFRFLDGSTADLISNETTADLPALFEQIFYDAGARNLWEENADIISKSLPDDYDEEQWIALDRWYIRNAWQDVRTVPADYDDALAVLFSGAFMQPTFQKGVFYTWEDADGIHYADSCADIPEEYQDLVDTVAGVLCYMSAPGYLDRTDDAFFETFGEAANHLIETYAY